MAGSLILLDTSTAVTALILIPRKVVSYIETPTKHHLLVVHLSFQHVNPVIQPFCSQKNDGSDKHVINFTDENCFLDDTGHRSLEWNNTDYNPEFNLSKYPWDLFQFSQDWYVNVENRTLCDTHSVQQSKVHSDSSNKCTQV